MEIVGISTKFFTFSCGVHLSEGSTNEWWYALTVDECAQRCLVSSRNSPPDQVRCLSFDFYPIESPKTGPPWNEELGMGMCVLNAENRNSARLRNEDMGYSDAELFYTSHFTSRPFSDLDGHYELRNPRGDELGEMLSYSAVTPDLNIDQTWGGSRWGQFLFEGPVRAPPVYECPDPQPADRDPTKFLGGYTPISEDQHCPGLQTKAQAEATCAATGGFLCSADPVMSDETGQTYVPLQTLFGKKIGCALDGDERQSYPIWTAEAADKTSGGKVRRLFTRCCNEWGVIVDCQLYSNANLNFCSRLETATDCVGEGSGTALQNTKGFGNMLDEIRQNCQRSPTDSCRGARVKRWSVRDRCVWCLKPGVRCLCLAPSACALTFSCSLPITQSRLTSGHAGWRGRRMPRGRRLRNLSPGRRADQESVRNQAQAAVSQPGVQPRAQVPRPELAPRQERFEEPHAIAGHGHDWRRGARLVQAHQDTFELQRAVELQVAEKEVSRKHGDGLVTFLLPRGTLLASGEGENEC